MAEDQRTEWRMISERERLRRKGIENLRSMMQAGETRTNRTPKSLLTLVVRGQGLTVNDAANILQVNRGIIIEWARLLRDRKLIEIDSPATPNPLLKPTKALIEKLSLYRIRKGAKATPENRPATPSDIGGKSDDYINAREDRIKLGEDLERRTAELKDKEKELDRERNLRRGLEEQIKKLEGQIKGGNASEIDELKIQLEREHREKAKVEELLSKERDDLARTRNEISERYLQKERNLSERERGLVERERAAIEDEELEILFGDDVGYESLLVKTRGILGLIHERLLAWQTKPNDEKTRKELAEVIKEEEDLGRILSEDARLLSEESARLEHSEASEVTARPIEDVKAVPERISELVALLEEKGGLRVSEAAIELGTSEEVVNAWGIRLASRGAVRLVKHITGGDELMLLENANTKKLKDDLEDEDRQEQLRRIKEEEKRVG